jgi:putative intracellular protease/amidase
MHSTIYLYVLDTMADWEVGYTVAELQSQRYFAKPTKHHVKTVAAEKKPITTLGGVHIVPDASVDEIKIADTAVILLPGADTWMQPEHQNIIEKAKEFLQKDIPVAAICGGTGALAQAGILDNKKHTSNGLPYLQMTCPNYHGSKYYQDDLAVTDGALITAGSSAPVEFAYRIFKKLAVFRPDMLENWYGYFGKHDIKAIFRIYDSLSQKSV